MTSTEIFRALNEFMALYPNYYKNQSREAMERVAKSWQKKFESVSDYDAFIDALYEFERTNDYPNPPTTKQWIDLYKSTKTRKQNGVSRRRIVTVDEEMYNIYLKEMQKEPGKRNEWLIKQCLPFCKIMTDPEAFKRKYGKSREEFEKL